MAASPVPVPGAAEELEPEELEPEELAADEDADEDVVLLDEVLPELLEPQPATTRASAARAATAPVRGTDRWIRELRTNDLLRSTGVPRMLRGTTDGCCEWRITVRMALTVTSEYT